MRIVMLIQRYFPHIGGAETQLEQLGGYMRSQGLDVHVITRRYDPSLREYEVIDGIPVYRLSSPPPKALASMLYTALAGPLIRRLKPDVIHAHEVFSPTTTAVLAKRLFKIPIVTTAHRSGPLGDVQRLKEKLFGNRRLDVFRKEVDAFAVISREIRDELSGARIPTERLHDIPNGVDATRFTPLPDERRKLLRSELGLPADGPLTIFCGRLAREKRVNNLLAVWPDVRKIYPDASLLILGNGDQEKALKQSAGEGVIFLDGKPDVFPYLQASDVFVLPSIAEGFSVAMLEALSCGLPILVTRVGANEDVIADRESGWLIPPDDLPALKDGLITLLGDSDLRSRLGRNGRELILQNYDLPIVAERLIDLYQKVASQQAAPYINH